MQVSNLILCNCPRFSIDVFGFWNIIFIKHTMIATIMRPGSTSTSNSLCCSWYSVCVRPDHAMLITFIGAPFAISPFPIMAPFDLRPSSPIHQ